MKIYVLPRWTALAFSLAIYTLLCSGCGMLEDKPADQELSLVLAGMDGTDGVSFEGAAGLLVDGQAVAESSLYYGGKVTDHNKVSLYTLLPDKEGGSRAAARSDAKKLGALGTTTAAYYTQLEKKDGEWAMLAATPASAASNPLPALNPLRQLEELEKREKKVTERAKATRGTQQLRIELTPQEAKKQLSEDLQREMEAIRPPGAGKQPKVSGTPQREAEALTALWEQKEAELQQRLEQTEVSSVYFLNMDVRHNLPKSLTWTRKVNYPGNGGSGGEETYVSKVEFYGYR